MFAAVIKGAAGTQFAFLETLTRATPLIFTGLAAAVAFRAKLWNIGGEAQLYAGAIMAIVLGTGALPLPGPVLIPMIMAAAMLAGALLLLGPTFLKTRFGVDEVVTTLLLNFVDGAVRQHAARRRAQGPDGPRLAAVQDGDCRGRSCPS